MHEGDFIVPIYPQNLPNTGHQKRERQQHVHDTIFSILDVLLFQPETGSHFHLESNSHFYLAIEFYYLIL